MKRVAAGIWETPNEVWLPGGICFEGRMTTMKLASGGLLLHSPVPIDDDLAAQLAAAGEVEHIVAPNLVHHLYAGAAKERYPNATLWAAPGLAEKAKLDADRVIEDAFPDEAVTVIPLPTAPHLHEAAFLHRPSRSLVVCDLVFNIHRPKGWGMPLLLSMVGCRGRLRVSRSMKFHFAKHDWARLGAAVRALAELPWDRLIMAHGDIVEEGGREALLEGAAWLP